MRALALTALLVAAAAAGVTAPAAASPADGDGDPCVTSVAFYTVSEPDPPPVRIGYSADADDRVFFVASVDGAVVGHTDLQTYPARVAVDGQPVPLEDVPTGPTTLTVTVYRDADGDGEFDASADEPCVHEGERVDATRRFTFPNGTAATPGPATATVDLETPTAKGTATPTAGPGDAPTPTDGGDTGASAPGLGVGVAAVAVLAAAALARGR